jgi:outer membrane biosynthesis protein TonB
MGCSAYTYCPVFEPQKKRLKKELTSEKTDLNARSVYVYGFNGQEKDNEVAGSGNVYTAMYWEYDARLGRRWNMDPVVKEEESPYACFNNSPILMEDQNGDDPGTAAAVAIATQEVAAAAAATGVGVAFIPFIEVIGGAFALYELLEDVEPTTTAVKPPVATPQKPKTAPPTAAKTKPEVAKAAPKTAAKPVPQVAKAKPQAMAATKKPPKDLKKEAEEAKAKEQAAAQRAANRKAQTQRGNTRSGNSNKDVKGSHHKGKGNSDDHTTANARRAAEQAKSQANNPNSRKPTKPPM